MNGEITNGEIVETCIHQLISKHVRARPDDEAVASSSGESLTYSALDDAAERVAHPLRAHGAGPERFVVVCFEKCIWTGKLSGPRYLLPPPRMQVRLWVLRDLGSNGLPHANVHD